MFVRGSVGLKLRAQLRSPVGTSSARSGPLRGPRRAIAGEMVYLTQLIYLRDGGAAGFHQFEDLVLPLLAKHGGELIIRLRPDDASHLGGAAERPYEVHVVRFADEANLAGYANDPERRAALPLKAAAVRHEVVIRGALA